MDAGAELVVSHAGEQELPAKPDGYQGVVVLGDGQGALDAGFTELRTLLSGSVAAGIPVLAIGLGAQLLAVATGGGVRQAERGPAVGPALVAKRDVGAQDPLFADLPLMPDVLQLHSDEVNPLPPTAELLASSPKYANQAFRVGKHGYALQFHIETTPEHVLDWAQRNPELAGHARPGALDYDRLAGFHDELEEAWKPFAQRFVQLADGQLSGGVVSGKPLPLV